MAGCACGGKRCSLYNLSFPCCDVCLLPPVLSFAPPRGSLALSSLNPLLSCSQHQELPFTYSRLSKSCCCDISSHVACSSPWPSWVFILVDRESIVLLERISCRCAFSKVQFQIYQVLMWELWLLCSLACAGTGLKNHAPESEY